MRSEGFFFVLSTFLGCSPAASSAGPHAAPGPSAGAHATPPAAASLTPSGVLEGELITYKAGQPVGVQKYRDDGDHAASAVQLGPNRYTIELSRSARTVACNGGAPQALDERTLALENGDWQAYSIAASRFSGAAEPVDVKILFPCSGRSLPGSISVNREGSARRVVLHIGPLSSHVFVDERGAVTEASVPLQDLVVRASSRAAPPPPAALPAGVSERELGVSSGGVELKGTAWIPSAATAAVPVVLIIAGSGPTDRDGNSLLGVRSDSYRMLASELARRGIASVRYDKRGVGASGRNFALESVVLADFVKDAAAWIQLIRSERQFGKLTVLGHSEGGLVALLAAKHAPDALVLVACPGRPLDALVRSQVAAQAPPELLEDYDRITRALRAKRPIEPVPQPLAPLFNAGTRAFFASAMPVEPAAELKNLSIDRVTIVQGTTDLQVSVQDAQALAAARPSARSSVIQDMNHVLKQEPSKAGPQPSYTDPTRPLASGLVDAVVAGIAR